MSFSSIMKSMEAISGIPRVPSGFTGALLGTELAELDDDVKNLLGETATLDVEPAIPVFAIGKPFELSGFSGVSRMVVRFSAREVMF